MTDTVPAAPPPREARRAGDLKPGDWLHEDAFDGFDTSEVLSVHPFRDFREQRVLVVVGVQGGAVETVSWNVDQQVPIATEAERVEAATAVRRDRITDLIRELALLIDDHQLPIPLLWGGIRVHIDLPDVAGVAAVAAAIGAEVKRGTYDHHVSWPTEPDLAELLTVMWVAYFSDAEHDPSLRASETPEGLRVPGYVDGAVSTPPGRVVSVPPLISPESIADVDAVAARDRAAGGPPWEIPSHPDNVPPERAP